jgi:hypothetical protein
VQLYYTKHIKQHIQVFIDIHTSCYHGYALKDKLRNELGGRLFGAVEGESTDTGRFDKSAHHSKSMSVVNGGVNNRETVRASLSASNIVERDVSPYGVADRSHRGHDDIGERGSGENEISGISDVRGTSVVNTTVQ